MWTLCIPVQIHCVFIGIHAIYCWFYVGLAKFILVGVLSYWLCFEICKYIGDGLMKNRQQDTICTCQCPERYVPSDGPIAWWCHQMETFSALLALCAGNSPVTGEFPSQWPVTRSFDVCFDLRLNKRLSKQSRRRWFEMPSHSLWCHSDWWTHATNILWSLHWNPVNIIRCFDFCSNVAVTTHNTTA